MHLMLINGVYTFKNFSTNSSCKHIELTCYQIQQMNDSQPKFPLTYFKLNLGNSIEMNKRLIMESKNLAYYITGKKNAWT